MATLIYSASCSLDGYVEDEDGSFEFARPDEEILAFVNESLRPVGTFLLGRRMYDTMLYWESADPLTDPSRATRDFAEIWRTAEKVVFSRTLDEVTAPRSRLEREFNPAVIRQMMDDSKRDLCIGGAEIAGLAMWSGLVDEVRLLVTPAIVGGGRPALPAKVRRYLELLEHRRFDGGVVYLRYRLTGG